MTKTMTIENEDEWDEYADLPTVSPRKIVNQGSWHLFLEKVVHDEASGKYYRLEWEEGATETVDLTFSDYYHTVTEVVPSQISTTVYVDA